MAGKPCSSPWGAIQAVTPILPGVYDVIADCHGGIMVRADAADFLSPAAKTCGARHNGYLCYEEDYDYQIVLRELLDKKMWQIPADSNKAEYEAQLNESLEFWNPAYWRARESVFFGHSENDIHVIYKLPETGIFTENLQWPAGEVNTAGSLIFIVQWRVLIKKKEDNRKAVHCSTRFVILSIA